jgi:membrane-associated protease RseP (regulator of RpoE activity)
MGIVPSIAATQSRGSCQTGEIETASLGYAKLECNCVVGYIEGQPGRTLYEFRSEPKLWGIEDGGPADGKLKEGDVVTAIDGYLITTAEGGSRFGAVKPGESVALTVRRDGRELDVTITPAAQCKAVTDLVPAPVADMSPEPARAWSIKTAPRAVVYVRPDTVMVSADPISVRSTAPAEPGAPRVILPPPVPDYTILPRGWLGFSVSCSDCKVIKVKDEESVRWEFSGYPEITRVEPGSPAHEAGIRAGDVLTHIDSHELTEVEGGRLFGAVQPGDSVAFRYVRGGEERSVTLVAGERQVALDEPLMPPPKQSPQPDVMRFSGVFGEAFIEVTGGPIVVNRSGGELVISSKDITVRIKRAGGGN